MPTTRNAAASALLFYCGMLSLVACSGDLPPPTDLSVDPVNATPARFSVEYQRGQLKLNGDAASAEHKQQLVDLATRRFPAVNRTINLDFLDSAPTHWQETTVQLVDALAATQSASALLTNNTLRVRGIAKEDWPDGRSSLRASLPESVTLMLDVIEPDRDIDVAGLCTRAMTRHKVGPINFEESGTAFRSSALPELERVMVLANSCRNSDIEIIGHTDSSGDETWNQRLSLARAQAVADFLAQQGIAKDRLRAVGAGSSLPIADNANRYGRSLNRRIDIRFSVSDGAPR